MLFLSILNIPNGRIINFETMWWINRVDSHHSLCARLSPGSGHRLDLLRRGLTSKGKSKEGAKSAVNLLIHLSVVEEEKNNTKIKNKRCR